MNGLTLRISGCGSKKTKNSFGFPTVSLSESNHVHLANKNKEVQQFLQASNVEQQLTHLKNILTSKDTLLDEDLIRFIVRVFLHAEVKHPVKCFLTRSITKSDNLQQPFAAALSEAILSLITDPHTSYRCYVSVVARVLTCVENFPAGAAAVKNIEIPLAQYLMSGLNCTVSTLNETKCLSPTEKNEVFNLAHSILRLILYIIQKVSPDHIETLNSMLLDIRACFKNLLFDDDVPMDTKSVCGIVFVSMYILQNNPDSWVNILNSENKDETLHSFLESDASRLSLYSAIATVVPTSTLQAHTVHDTSALILLTTSIVDVGDRTCSDSTFNLAVARTLVQISKGLHRLERTLGLRLVDVLLPYVWGHLDHHMDSVRHLSGQVLANVVRYCARLQEEGDGSALDELFSSLGALDRRRKSYYVSLAALTSSLGSADVTARLPDVVCDVMDHLHVQAVQASATTALETLLYKQTNVSSRALYERWLVPVLARAGRALDSPELAILEGLLTKVVKLDPGVMEYILPYIKRERDDSPTECDLKTVLMLVSVGRKAGVLGARWMELVGRGVLEAAAVSSAEQTRILSLSLVVESPRSTEVFAAQELALVLHFLRYNANARAPNFRQLVLSLLKKFLKRFEDSHKVLQRQKGAGDDADDYYVRFLEDLRSQCFASLLPGANYGRRCVALQTLAWAETCLEGYKRVWKEEYVEKLLLHLEDSYENNKALALEILHHCPGRLLQDKKYSISLDIRDIFQQAESVKPTDCVSAAYKLSLLQDKLPQNILEGQEWCDDIPELVSHTLLARLLVALRAGLAACAGSVAAAARRAPMYPLLHCMRRALRHVHTESISRSEAWSSLVAELVSTCMEVTARVAGVVNNSSPEGHLPMDMGGVEVTDHGNSGNVRLADGRPVTAQMVLLCAWRSVKEVSLLLGEMCSRLELGPGGLLTFSQVEVIGEHFTTLLAETKHRGAFEQAYVGFTLLLARLWRHRSPELHELPRRWLDELMAAIQSPGQSKLCATRRSAGLPFMIQALVTTELQVRANATCFDACMCTLLRVARAGDVTARTHARNVVRALVRCAPLRDAVASHLGRAVWVAVDGFDGSTWEERNSSTLLFSALMVRMFGVQRTRGGGGEGALCARDRMTGRVFFLRYPELYDLLLSKLEEASRCGGAGGALRPALYPALLLLGRLYPSALEGTVSNLKLVSFTPHVVRCARSGDLRARRLAAAAARALVEPSRYISHLESMLRLLGDRSIERNCCHGVLLQITRLLEYRPDEVCVSGGARGARGAGVREGVRGALWTLRQPCYVIADECLKMVSLLLWKFDTIFEREDIDNIVASLNILLFNNTDSPHAPGKAVCAANCAYLYFIILNLYDSGDICTTVYRCLSHACYEVVISALNYVLILHNELDIDDTFQEHLAKVSVKYVLKDLNTPTYLELLCDIIRSNKYLECNQKALKVLTLTGDTQSHIIRAKEGNIELTEDIIIEKLFYYIENEHENLIHVYLQSLCHFLSKMLRSANVNGHKMLEAIRVIFACSSCDNSEGARRVVVDFLEENIELLLAVDLQYLQDGEKFEYKATLYCTLVTMLEDDEASLSQRSSDLITRAVCGGGGRGAACDVIGGGDVISSRSAECLRRHAATRGDARAVALLATVALLDFKSEVVMTDEGNDECRVFDQNEKYNINLEEAVWTRGCAEEIRTICKGEGDKDLVQYVRDVLAHSAHRPTVEKLCGNNYLLFSNVQSEVSGVSGVANPKVQLFINDLSNV